MYTTFYAYYNLYLIQYPLCTPPWNIFAPPCRARGACAIKYFGVPLKMTPPAPAPPAILAYLTLANKLSVSWDTIHYMKPPTATPPSLAPGASSAEWHAEWTRGLHLADTTKPLGAAFSGAFISGSLEGTWEGLFTVRLILLSYLYDVTHTMTPSIRSLRRMLPCCPGHHRPSCSEV